jgi:hypothetical protein
MAIAWCMLNVSAGPHHREDVNVATYSDAEGSVLDAKDW